MKLLKFYKENCVPCNMLSNFLEMIEVIPDESYNFADSQDMVDKYGVMSVPTLIAVNEDGNEIARVSGVGHSKINDFLEQAGLL